MGVSKKHKIVLYALCHYLQECNKRFSDAPLSMSVSKISFIEMAKKAKICDKSIRALYKNLEDLENKKYLNYSSRQLRLTQKGLGLYNKINREVGPFVNITKSDVSKFTKGQVVFR